MGQKSFKRLWKVLSSAFTGLLKVSCFDEELSGPFGVLDAGGLLF